MPGQGKPECELFHPSDDLRYSWTSAAPDYDGPPIDPLQLSIELEPDTDSRSGPRKWVLVVPKSPDEHGQISVDLGGGDIRKIPLANLALGARNYLADPDTADFAATWTSPEVNAEYRSAVEARIFGLCQHTVNVFAVTRQKLKPRCGLLHWGESYYFIWHTSQSVAFPPEMFSRALAANRGWSCSLVTLPDQSDPEIKTWLEQTCDLAIARAKREWALVSPPSYAIDDDGDLLVPPTSQFVLAIKPTDAVADQVGQITCSCGNAAQSVNLTGASRHLVEVSVAKGTIPTPTYLTWDGTPMASLIAKPYPALSREPVVLVEFSAETSTLSVPLHHLKCRTLLTKVRASEALMIAVRLPSVLRGTLHWRDGGQVAWETEVVSCGVQPSSTAGQASLGIHQIEKINRLLQTHSLAVRLDFGPFGQFNVHAIPQAALSSSRYQLRRELRQRIEWLCKSSGTFALGERPLATLADEELISCLPTLSVPPSLAAHKRALERQLPSAGRVSVR